MDPSKLEEISIVKLCHQTSSTMAIMDFEGLGKEYFDDSEEEYDLAIDPVWEAQQISTFTAWCNAHLRKVDMRIESFERDFRSGFRLMKLLEIISNDILPAPDKGKMRLHYIANVNKCLKFIEDKGVKLASIGAEEIVDGNVKMTLGMIWTIILRFTIQDIQVEDLSAREGLLLWCKRRTNGYNNINVENFRTSFQDGLVFCALLHKYDRTLLNYDSLFPNNKLHNLQLAFAIAESHLDVPQMLSIADMIDNSESDEKSIMTYVSSYYHAIESKEKIRSALGNIREIVSKQMEEEKRDVNRYSVSVMLTAWIANKIVEFQNRPLIDNESILNEQFDKFKHYKYSEKPEKTEEKIQIQLIDYQKNSAKGISPKYSAIQDKWNEMESLEIQFEEYLSEQFRRYELIQNLLNKFEFNFQIQRSWISSKIDVLISKDYESVNLQELKTMKRSQETFSSNIQSQKTIREKLYSIANELRRLNYHDMATIEKKLEVIQNPWENLGHLHSRRTENINIFLNALSEIDDLQLEFAKRVVPIYDWAQLAIQDLNDTFTFHSVDEIKDLIKAQESFKSTVVEAMEELNYVTSLNDEICKIITVTGILKVPRNPYTDLLIQDIQKTWIKLEKSISERDKTLHDALLEQINISERKDNFAKLSKNVAEKLNSVQENLHELLSSTDDPHETKSKFQALETKVDSCYSPLREIGNINQELSEHNKLDSFKMHYSYEQLNTVCDVLKNFLSDSSQLDENISPKLMKFSNAFDVDDYKACFRHFDRSNSNQLDPHQFKACLLSLGLNCDYRESQFQEIMIDVDPEHTGFISLPSFLAFVHGRNAYQSKMELLIESFKILANNQDSISRSTIINELPAPIADYCIQNMPVKISSSGDNECYLDYKSFGAKLFGNQPDPQVNGSE